MQIGRNKRGQNEGDRVYPVPFVLLLQTLCQILRATKFRGSDAGLATRRWKYDQSAGKAAPGCRKQVVTLNLKGTVPEPERSI
jgi:hypothetical protein